MAEVAVEGLHKDFGATRALDGVSLRVEDGSFFGILGPSGSGKTTLLRAVAGFAAVDRGRVLIGGRPVEGVPPERREIGMVFQSYALFPHMSVADNVGFGLDVRGVNRAERARRVEEALALVRLEGLGGRRPAELSGGQRQRVAMARALAPRPRVLLLDEPLSALDRSLRAQMQVELKRIQRAVGVTTLFVTHDQEEAMTLSDRIAVMRDGRLVREGPPREVYRDPGDAFTARFLGEANILGGAPEGDALRLPDGTRLLLAPGRAATALAAVRPEDVAVTPHRPAADNAVAARVARRVFSGAAATLELDWAGGSLRATGRDRDLEGFAEGQPVWASWARAAALPVRPD